MLTSAAPGARNGWARVLRGATVGGALAGAADAAATLARGVAGLSAPRALSLLALATGSCALAGAALGAMALALTVLARRLGARERAPIVAAVVLAAPLATYDAFALFSGHQAARVPAHGLLSVLLAAGALVAVAFTARAYLRADHGRPARLAAAGLLALGAVVLYAADRLVLPRLYPWFHATLSALTLVAAAAAATLLVGERRRQALRAALAVFAAGALFAGSMRGFAHSQLVRYAAHERTLVTALVLARLPLPRGGRVFTHAGAAIPDEPLPDGPHRPNADVVLVTIDALRADHVGAYGYERPTTPNIDAFARRAVRFTRVYAQAPHTSFSVSTMLTGKYYPTIAHLAPGDAHDPIAQVLRQYGWKTAAFYPPAVFFVDAHKLKAYEETNFGFEYVKVEFLDAFKRLDQIEDFFTKEHPAKTFLWLHFFEPHEPYDARAGYFFGRRDIDRYDSEIAYTDAALGKLLAYLEERHPGAIVIVTADHGEEFDEHNGRYHGTTLFEEQVRVPLLISVPGVPAHVVEGPVELVDITPTILGLLDIPIPARVRGTDLGPWLGSPPAPNGRLPPAFGEVADKRMAVWGTDKLICEMSWGYCSYYDLLADPHEQKNLAEERPERAAALKQRLDQWLDDNVRFEPQLVRGPANPEGGGVPRAIERGRLGDLGAVGGLAALLSSSQPVPVRREAARLLVALPPRPETRSDVMAALGSHDEDVRSWAAVAAARLGDSASREKLHALVARPDTDDPEHSLGVHAAMALGYLGDARGVPLLAGSLDRCEKSVVFCQRIIAMLGALRDRRAVPALLEHLPEVLNRRDMVVALGAIGDPRVTGELVERLRSDGYVPVRAAAATALAKLGGPGAVAGLQWSLRHEREPSVLAADREALASLGRRASAEDAQPAEAASQAR